MGTCSMLMGYRNSVELGCRMSMTSSIAGHYQGGDLLGRLTAALEEDGVDPASPTLEALAPYDHFHGRGLEATVELANSLEVSAGDHLLDMGAGMGGPARYMASRFGCRVTAIDLTAEFCDLAEHLNKLTDLDGNVIVKQGDVLAMPFDDDRFDGAYSMNVSMNIEDKAAFYREIFRVLRPGAWLVLSEIAKGPDGQLQFPTPWAKTGTSSFLATPEATTKGLEATGFTSITLRDTTREALDFAKRSREKTDQGGKPPHRAVRLVHGDMAAAASANSGRGLRDGATIPIEIACLKP